MKSECSLVHSDNGGGDHSQLSGLRTDQGKDGMPLDPYTTLWLFG
jgi:hypothetical protein